MTDSRVASLAALLRPMIEAYRLWATGRMDASDFGSIADRAVIAFDKATASDDGLITVGSRLGEPSPARGTPSEAQMQAAREGWSGNLPLPSDAELRVIVEAVNRAAWPDGVRAGSEETP